MKRKPNKTSFKPGCKPGPGRPSRAIEDSYLESLRAEVTPDRWRRVVARALKDAEAGDASARNWLSRYLLPRDGLDPIEACIEFLRREG